MDQANQLLTLGMLIFSILQLILTLPFWKYLFKLRDTVISVDTLKEEFVDNITELHKKIDTQKESLEKKIQDVEREASKQKETYHREMQTLQKEISANNLAFAQTLGILNGTLAKLEGTLSGFKVALERGEENIKERITSISKELEEHKESTRDLIKELKEIKHGS